MSERRGFASDNHAGVHPEVMEAIAAANEGHAAAYGADPWTARAQERFRAHFGPSARAFPVFNGTAANVLSVEALTHPWEAVICARTAHLQVDECGAPERAGRKLLTVDTPDGRLTPELVEPLLVRIGEEHAVQPRLISIAQSTELGTVYRPGAVSALAEWAHAHGLLLHVDGARLSNAAAGLGLPLRALTTDAGVDAVSFGGTKNGLMGAEAVVLLGDDLGDGFKYRRKQAMQLASKMRYISAQLEVLLTGDLWERSAAHANAMARRLAAAVQGLEGVRVTQPVEANAVFAVLPPPAAERLQRSWPFYVWDEATGEVRWMASWDTTEAEVDAFAADVRAATT
jgi:threonine aldolase